MSNVLRKHSFCLLAIIIASVLLMPANIFAANKDRASNEQRLRQPRGDQQQRSEEMLKRIAQSAMARAISALEAAKAGKTFNHGALLLDKLLLF